jgi:hypothetical protein
MITLSPGYYGMFALLVTQRPKPPKQAETIALMISVRAL